MAKITSQQTAGKDCVVAVDTVKKELALARLSVIDLAGNTVAAIVLDRTEFAKLVEEMWYNDY